MFQDGPRSDGVASAPSSANVAEMLRRAAARRPAADAIIARDGTVDYRRLERRAGEFAVALSSAGIRAGDRVAVFVPRGADAAAAFFGTAVIGGVSVMVNETLRPRQIEYILEHAGARAFVADRDLLARQPRSPDAAAALLYVDDVRPTAAAPRPVRRVLADPAQIIYTSGSTGPPKGVTVSHGNLWAGVRAVTRYVGIGAADRIAGLLPFSFDYGFNQLICAVAAGAALVIERSPLPSRIVATLRERRVTVLPAVPPLWLSLLDVPAFRERPLAALRAMTNTGGHLPIRAVRALRRAHPGADLFLMYGLTEAFRATYLPPDEVDARPNSIGGAIPGAEVMVLHDDGTRCAPGETGELVQRGPTVALGYWNDPEATARVFRPNPLRPDGTPASERVVFSGDLVRRDEEGFLYFVGRRDRMIKTLGYRVSPDEVAEVLHASGEVAEAVVTSEPDEARGRRIIALVVLADGGSLERLRRHCRLELPRYMQPSRIIVREELPRTASGKYAS